jgi:HAD superfamily hydrolase (TIGR01509 family)
MADNAAYDALIFDLGGVIVPHDNDVLAARLVSRCTAPDAARRLNAVAHAASYGNGERTIAQLHGALVAELGYDGDWPRFVEDWSCHLSLDPSMLALIERLAQRYRVMLFSNTNQEHWDHVVRLSDGRLGRLEAYLSHEIGDLKPALSSFALVAAKAGVEPGRCLFIDDRLDNVEAARRAGFHAEVFTSQAALEDLLRAAGMVTA